MGRTLTKTGRYQIVGELGHGSMGVVYKGFDPIIGRTVAIKTMLTEALPASEFEEYKARFQREAQAAGVLTHPNIVTVYDFGEDDGVLFLAMEYLEGESLQHLVEAQGVLPVETVIPMYEQVCSALDAAHARKIVHRDVKPANIMILESGLVKMTDFGIAKIMSTGMTQAGQILGTPNYMSPEQVKGRSVDGRSDIFSLGVILYELVTGEKPFGGQNITTVIYKIINENPIPPRELDPTLHLGLSYVIQKALAKNPAERYQTCRELADELRNYRSLGGALAPSATVAIRVPPMQAMATETVVPTAAPTPPAASYQPPPSARQVPGPPKRPAPVPPRIEPQRTPPTVTTVPEKLVPVAPRPTQVPAPAAPHAEPVPSTVAAPLPAPPPPSVTPPLAQVEKSVPALPVEPPVISRPKPAQSSAGVWAIVVLIIAGGLAGGGYYFYKLRRTAQVRVNPNPAPPVPTLNPVPAVNSISPNSIDAGSAGASLIVNGSGFTQQSTVLLDGTTVTSTFNNSSQLAANVPANLLANAGTLQVSVSTPGPGGGTSTSAPLTVAEASTPPRPPTEVTETPGTTPGRLLVDSTPTGAVITLDGKTNPNWVTPHTFSDVPEGPHRVSLSLGGYKTVTQTARVQAGHIRPLVVNLQATKGGGTTVEQPTPEVTAPPGSGVISFASIPTGADVYVDDKFAGKTPIDVTVSAGQHSYRIECPVPGFAPVKNTADVVDGIILERKATWNVPK